MGPRVHLGARAHQSAGGHRAEPGRPLGQVRAAGPPLPGELAVITCSPHDPPLGEREATRVIYGWGNGGCARKHVRVIGNMDVSPIADSRRRPRDSGFPERGLPIPSPWKGFWGSCHWPGRGWLGSWEPGNVRPFSGGSVPSPLPQHVWVLLTLQGPARFHLVGRHPSLPALSGQGGARSHLGTSKASWAGSALPLGGT